MSNFHVFVQFLSGQQPASSQHEEINLVISLLREACNSLDLDLGLSYSLLWPEGALTGYLYADKKMFVLGRHLLVILFYPTAKDKIKDKKILITDEALADTLLIDAGYLASALNLNAKQAKNLLINHIAHFM